MSEMIETRYCLSLHDRFWSKVDIRQEDKCWQWIASSSKSRNSGPYGIFRIGTMKKSHRVAWELHNQTTIPRGMIIRHKCDNPICCNPHHLELGTLQDNVDDREKRGRSNPNRGRNHPLSKLTEEDVKNIRKRLAAGESQRQVARSYNMSQFGISYAKNGWGHVK